MDFFQRAGKLAFGSYLRRLGEMMLQWSVQIYSLYDISLDVRYFPVFQALLWLENPTVSALASYVGLTHAAVSQTLKELSTQGYITLSKNASDKRQTSVKLSTKGKREQARMETLLHDLDRVMTDVFAECALSPLAALQDFERAVTRKNLLERIQYFRKEKMTESITITGLARRGSKQRNKQLEAFRQLNYEWIEHYFTIEKADRKALDHAEEYIIGREGVILCAERENKIVGAVALIPHETNSLELAKMVVSPSVRGQNVGLLLGEAALAKAREMGAKRVYLESNTKLEAAINLYYKLGFKRVANFVSPYERANIAMELWL
jgi:putative acetyltransferase